MITQNTLIDNSSEKLLMSKNIRDFLSKPGLNVVRIATGYWDLLGLMAIQDELSSFLAKEGTQLQLLIGKDPFLYPTQKVNPTYKDASYPADYIRRDINELGVKEEYEKSVNILLEHCQGENPKFQVRIYKTNEQDEAQFLHSKCYIFSGLDENGDSESIGIVGSSNFTGKGLDGNAELNYAETSTQIVEFHTTSGSAKKGHIQWFEERWEISEEWTKEFLEQVIKETEIAKEIIKKKEEQEAPLDETQDKLTPYELYIKLLQMKFGSLVDRDATEALEEYLPEGYSRLDYQISAVKQCFSIMRTHGGFMLGDVVGLGKTIVGTMIVRYFLDFPDDGHEKKVLIVTPPAIKSAWKNTFEEFDKGKSDRISDYVDFITTGSIDNILEDATEVDEEYGESGDFDSELKSVNYGLILIDESHKFRNAQTMMYQALDSLISQIGANTGAYPYIGLLSATPQNNTPDDLKNQIYLFERNREHCTLEKVEGGNLEGFFAAISRQYREARHNADAIIAHPEQYPDPKYAMSNVNKHIKEISEKVRDHVLCDILVRRTRTDIKKYYKDDIAKQNIKFPTISGPHELEYKMDDVLAKLFVDTMAVIAPAPNLQFDSRDYLCYYRYRTIQYFADPAVVKMYQGGNIDAERYSRQLAKIMQINLVKRLESSFAAFKSSLRNLRQYTQNMIDMWDHDSIFVCPDINVNGELDVRKARKKDPTKPLLTFEQCANDIRSKIKKLNDEGRNEKGRNAEYHRSDFKPEYIDLVRNDLNLVKDLCDRWEEYDADPKLDVFKDSLKPVLLNPETNPSGKLVIFSEAKDTVDALKRTLDNRGFKDKVLVIDAGNRDKLEKTIQANFDANFKGQQADDYQIIITTEVLAEGINLHRANVILNYDTPWNSTRLMQRIGRVNRIGTKADTVYVYNFFPSAQGNSMIQLVQKAYIKLQSFHVLFGEDSKVFTEDEEVKNYDLNTVVNGEESPFEKYVYELRQFKGNNPERYEYIKNAESGLELAVASCGSRYYLVKTETMSGLFVKVTPDGDARVIPGIEMYKEFAVPKDAIAEELPPDWEASSASAIRAFGQYLSRMNTAASRNAPATKAKGIISKLCESTSLSQESRNLLIAADRLIRKGNPDIIRKVIWINSQLGDENVLFSLSQAEIDQIISSAIEKLVEDQKKLTGKPFVYIGLAK